jgi:hypothetical protein
MQLYLKAVFLHIKPFTAQIYLIFIEQAVNKAIIQHERIRETNHEIFQRMKQHQPISVRLDLTLFSDIHHYFVCWAEVSKLYSKLRKIQPAFSAIPRECLQDLKIHRDFRNHLEHIEDRISRGVSDLGNLLNTEFTFDGKKVDIGDNDFAKLKRFYEELLNISLTIVNP